MLFVLAKFIGSICVFPNRQYSIQTTKTVIIAEVAAEAVFLPYRGNKIENVIIIIERINFAKN